MNEYTQIFLEGYGEPVFYPVEEGFLNTIWNTIVSIFKKIWESISNLFARIKKWIENYNKKFDEADRERIRKEVLNKNFEYTALYNLDDCKEGLDRSFDAMEMLFPVVMALKNGAKDPARFDPKRFTSSWKSTIDKYCIDDGSEMLPVYKPKLDVDPIPSIEKQTMAKFGDIGKLQEYISDKSTEFNMSVRNMQRQMGGMFSAVADYNKVPGTTENIKFINSAALSMTKTINNYYRHAEHCVEHLMVYSNRMLDDYLRTAKYGL